MTIFIIISILGILIKPFENLKWSKFSKPKKLKNNTKENYNNFKLKQNFKIQPD